MNHEQLGSLFSGKTQQIFLQSCMSHVFWAYHDKFKDFPSLLGLPSLFDLKSKVGSSGTLGGSGGAGIGARGLQ